MIFRKVAYKNSFFCIMLACSAQLFSYSYHFIQYQLTDSSRQELYPHHAAHPYRELMMHMWIPITEKPCPLILFSHGLGDNFNGMTYTYLCQYCASQGYIIASVSHTYGCKTLHFPDGRVCQYNFPAPFHRQTGKQMFDIEVDVWLADMRYVLDECARYNSSEESPLYGMLDMNRIGVMGHSLGGSVAIQLARNDNRIKAVINLDGPLYGTHAMIPIEKPYMMIIGSSVVCNSPLSCGGVPFHKEFMWRDYFNNHWLPPLNQFFASLYNDAYKIVINKIVHGTFSNEAFNPDPVIIPWILDARTAHTIIHSYVGAFFDHYLQNIDVPLLKESIVPWPNVLVERR